MIKRAINGFFITEVTTTFLALFITGPSYAGDWLRDMESSGVSRDSTGSALDVNSSALSNREEIIQRHSIQVAAAERFTSTSNTFTGCDGPDGCGNTMMGGILPGRIERSEDI